MRDIQRSMVREDAWQQLMLVVWIHDRMDRGLIVGGSVSEIRPRTDLLQFHASLCVPVKASFM